MNQPKLGNKRSVTIRLDSYDYKCIQLLANQTNLTVSAEIAAIIASVTAQTKALFSENQIDDILVEAGIKNEN